jgi:hypothetical protein
MSGGRTPSFKRQQRDVQIAFRAGSSEFSEAAKLDGIIGKKAYPFAIPGEHWPENLFHSIRDQTQTYFNRHCISWHRMRSHLLSSQICCLNFLMPFATRPKALAQLIAPIFPNVTMPPVEGERYVAFEWIGSKDYLNESRPTNGGRTRGANCTSTDAAIKFRRTDGAVILALIEWKYTESYGAPPDPKRAEERLRRYRDLAFDPDGPVRRSSEYELEHLFYEPFYQFLRQQMLAFHAAKAHEEGCDRAIVLHIAPKANVAFEKITVPQFSGYGGTAVSHWKSLLVHPDEFISVGTDELFGALDAAPYPDLHEWSAYINSRYGTLVAPTAPSPCCTKRSTVDHGYGEQFRPAPPRVISSNGEKNDDR